MGFGKCGAKRAKDLNISFGAEQSGSGGASDSVKANMNESGGTEARKDWLGGEEKSTFHNDEGAGRGEKWGKD